MIGRVFQNAVFAGSIAGGAVSVAQWFGTSPLIRAAEVYERGGGVLQRVWDDPERAALTVATNLLVGVGFGLLLGGAITLARRPVDARAGAAWGLAGFLAFALLPALGLPPELPGVPAAELGARQLWWLLAVAASVAGLLAITRGRGWIAAGAALLALPHVVGAPAPTDADTQVPAELAVRFAVVSLATSALFWLVLGAATGAIYRRAG